MMQFKIFDESSVIELERAIDKWVGKFAPFTKFDVQYKPVHCNGFYSVRYTALIRVIG